MIRRLARWVLGPVYAVVYRAGFDDGVRDEFQRWAVTRDRPPYFVRGAT